VVSLAPELRQMSSRRKFVSTLALLLGFLASTPTLGASAARGAEIASHRAAYTLSLDKSKTSAGLVAIEGAMVIEWQEVCDGWTLAQRMRFQAFDGEGNLLDNEISFSSWEAKDGRTYRFSTRTVRNGEESEIIRGRAELASRGKAGEATFNEPKRQVMPLAAGTMFPTEHSLALIEAAQAGERVIARTVFDGATVDGALVINAVIGPPLTAEPPLKAGIADVVQRPAWRVRMAFFKASESSPEYETSMRMLDNGIGTEFVFDYDEFAIKAVLDRLEALPKPRC